MESGREWNDRTGVIPRAYITEWSAKAPWQSDEQIEQDLLISRAICEIFQDEWLAEKLAFRGGTALHKLHLAPASRYSEDIDLVQIDAEPIKETVGRLRECLTFLGEASFEAKRNNNNLKYGVPAESDPDIPLRIKIEINCREHFSHLGFTKVPFEVDSSWFQSSCKITTYMLEELVGTKLRALYQRRKGRDLYDLYKLIEKGVEFDKKKTIACYTHYMDFSDGRSPSRKEFLMNLDEKMKDDEFQGDVKGLLHPLESFDIDEAYELVKEKFLRQL